MNFFHLAKEVLFGAVGAGRGLVIFFINRYLQERHYAF